MTPNARTVIDRCAQLPTAVLQDDTARHLHATFGDRLETAANAREALTVAREKLAAAERKHDTEVRAAVKAGTTVPKPLDTTRQHREIAQLEVIAQAAHEAAYEAALAVYDHLATLGQHGYTKALQDAEDAAQAARDALTRLREAHAAYGAARQRLTWWGELVYDGDRVPLSAADANPEPPREWAQYEATELRKHERIAQQRQRAEVDKQQRSKRREAAAEANRAELQARAERERRQLTPVPPSWPA